MKIPEADCGKEDDPGPLLSKGPGLDDERLSGCSIHGLMWPAINPSNTGLLYSFPREFWRVWISPHSVNLLDKIPIGCRLVPNTVTCAGVARTTLPGGKWSRGCYGLPALGLIRVSNLKIHGKRHWAFGYGITGGVGCFVGGVPIGIFSAGASLPTWPLGLNIVTVKGSCLVCDFMYSF